jgi:hypothetical protein
MTRPHILKVSLPLNNTILVTKPLIRETLWGTFKSKLQHFTSSVTGRRARKETDRLCSDETGGRDGKVEKKLKELKHEGHIALGK